MSNELKKMRLEILGNSTDDTNDEVFNNMLENATIIALNTLYPYDLEIQELPNNIRIKNWVVRCAIELYLKIGNNNVQSYSENGLSITYMTGLISTGLMNELIPKAGVPK